MERRNFLTGLFGGVTAAGLLIKTQDVKALDILKPNAPLVITPKRELPQAAQARPGDFVYNSEGAILGVIHSINVQRDMLDMSSMKDTHKQYVSGLTQVSFKVVSHA